MTSPDNSSCYDLIVIGAGASGIAAARSFHKTAPDAKVIVLEAREFVGGRTAPGERGAGYVDENHRRIRRVCDDVGLDFYSVCDEGKSILENVPGSFRTYEGTSMSGMSIRSLIGILKFFNSSEKTGCSLDGFDVETASWADPEVNGTLVELDKYTVADFIRSVTDDEEATNMCSNIVSPLFGASASSLSLLWFLFYIKSSTSFTRLISVTNGAQGLKINSKKGFEEMCLRMAKDLPTDAIKCGCPVSSISHNNEDGLVTVTTKNGEIFTAKRCILALSPSLYQAITFDPPLPKPKVELGRAFSGTSSYAKARVGFSSPWWRENGWSGQAASAVMGPASCVIDDVKPESFFEGDEEGARTNRYGLVLFITSTEAAAEWRAASDEEQRKKLACEQLRHIFGDERAVTQCVSYWDFDWESDDELAKYTDGCVPVLGPGNLEHWRHIRTSCWDGNLIFAGTETATISCGYVDGAIQSGERAAEDALMSLNLGSSGYTEEEPEKHKVKPNPRPFLEMFLFGRMITPEFVEEHSSKREKVTKQLNTCFFLFSFPTIF